MEGSGGGWTKVRGDPSGVLESARNHGKPVPDRSTSTTIVSGVNEREGLRAWASLNMGWTPWKA